METIIEQHIANLIRQETAKDVLNILRESKEEPETSLRINLLYTTTVKHLCNSLFPIASQIGTTTIELKEIIEKYVKSTITEYYHP